MGVILKGNDNVVNFILLYLTFLINIMVTWPMSNCWIKYTNKFVRLNLIKHFVGFILANLLVI